MFVIARAGFEAAMQDSDEAVAELAQGRAVPYATGTQLVVVGAGPG